MDPLSELKEIRNKVDKLIDGNFVLQARAIQSEVQMLRIELAKEGAKSKETGHVVEVLDGIDKDLSALIGRQTKNAT
jgi:hypothetical protein